MVWPAMGASDSKTLRQRISGRLIQSTFVFVRAVVAGRQWARLPKAVHQSIGSFGIHFRQCRTNDLTVSAIRKETI